ncbi:hypothetical protein FGB62_243g011 [Gracilaria domingensis]|nr:hypothetical protein FGB62_243g011 [Gracilaria domingensis]
MFRCRTGRLQASSQKLETRNGVPVLETTGRYLSCTASAMNDASNPPSEANCMPDINGERDGEAVRNTVKSPNTNDYMNTKVNSGFNVTAPLDSDAVTPSVPSPTMEPSLNIMASPDTEVSSDAIEHQPAGASANMTPSAY